MSTRSPGRSRGWSRGWSRVAAALAASLLLTGCAVRSGTPEGESSWHRKADQALGAAVSSLGSAALVLENQANGHLTRSYAVVAVRDAERILNDETATFASVQPPAAEADAQRRAVQALGTALTALNAAGTASAHGTARERRRALHEVRVAYRDLQRFADQLAGAGG